jgi:hypothetical protein
MQRWIMLSCVACALACTQSISEPNSEPRSPSSAITADDTEALASNRFGEPELDPRMAGSGGDDELLAADAELTAGATAVTACHLSDTNCSGSCANPSPIVDCGPRSCGNACGPRCSPDPRVPCDPPRSVVQQTETFQVCTRADGTQCRVYTRGLSVLGCGGSMCGPLGGPPPE